MTAPRPDVVRFLSDLIPAAAEECVWPSGMRLEISAFLTERIPPADLVSSVRSLLFRNGSVMLMTSKDGSQHLLPGGRCEPGESMEQTLQRELVEETGWKARAPLLLGFLRLNHLSPRPPEFRYPYPDSFQVVFCSDAEDKTTGPHEIDDEWEAEARFVPVSDAFKAELAPTDRAFLEAALARH